jgi:hypothetical protein
MNASTEITLTAANVNRDWTDAIRHRAGRELGLKLVAREFDVSKQDSDDWGITIIVLEDTTGVARATYETAVSPEWEVLRITRRSLITADQARKEAHLRGA